jgi:redox-sensitive bicupin YhaK (pirin superfamily)
LLAGIFTQNFSFDINLSRKYYLYVVSGTSTLNDIPLIEGDGLSFTEEDKINIITDTETEIILFDLG